MRIERWLSLIVCLVVSALLSTKLPVINGLQLLQFFLPGFWWSLSLYIPVADKIKGKKALLLVFPIAMSVHWLIIVGITMIISIYFKGTNPYIWLGSLGILSGAGAYFLYCLFVQIKFSIWFLFITVLAACVALFLVGLSPDTYPALSRNFDNFVMGWQILVGCTLFGAFHSQEKQKV